jgi:hypothetical protein
MTLQQIIRAMLDRVRWAFPHRSRKHRELTQLFQYHPLIFGKTQR